jgi:P22 coat protein - gene protein 5
MKILWFLQNALEIAAVFNTDWESEFGKSFPVGSSFQIKQPQSWLRTSGLAYQPQGISRLTTTVNLDQIYGIHFEWDSYERLVKMERSEKELEENYLYPAARELAQGVDSDAALWATLNLNNVVGALGTDATTIGIYMDAERRLFEKACPKGLRHLCLSPSAMDNYVKNNVTQFNPAPEISRMFRTGVVGTAGGWEWYRSNSLYKFTAGTAATHGVTIIGANQSGTSLIVQGTANDTILQGDKFTIASVNGVNPRTRRAGTMGLQNFTCTLSLTLTGNATDVLNISPPIFGPGSQYQNTDSLPANGAALTFWPGTASPSGAAGTISLGLSPFAFAIAGGKFEKPEKVERSEQQTDDDTGMSIRFVRAWDQRESKMTNRYDMAYGFGNFYADNAGICIAGA